MKKNNILLGLLTFVFLQQPAQAGHDVANGGNAVVCYADQNKQNMVSVQLFDYWESDQLRPELGNLDLGSESLSVKDKVNLFIKKVSFFDYKRAVKYKAYSEILLNDLSQYIVNDITGPLIDDDHSTAIPAAPCYKEQFAIQIRNPAPGERRFKISARLFNSSLANNDTKAGILIHEIVYRTAIIDEKITNSDGTRLMNSVYAKEKYKTIDSVELRDFYNLANMDFYKLHKVQQLKPYNVNILVNETDASTICNTSPCSSPVVYPKNRTLFSGVRIHSPFFSYELADSEYGTSYYLDANDNLIQISDKISYCKPFFSLNTKVNGNPFIFSSNGNCLDKNNPQAASIELNLTPDKKVKSINGDSKVTLSNPLFIEVAGKRHPCSLVSSNYTGENLNLGNNGKVLGCHITPGHTFNYLFNGQNLLLGCRVADINACKITSFTYSNFVRFSEVGKLLIAFANQNFLAKTILNNSVTVLKGDFTHFNQDEQVLIGKVSTPLLFLDSQHIKHKYEGVLRHQSNGHYRLDGEGKLTASIDHSDASAPEGFMLSPEDVNGFKACPNVFGSNLGGNVGYPLKYNLFNLTPVFGTQKFINVSAGPSGAYQDVTDDQILTSDKIECKASEYGIIQL